MFPHLFSPVRIGNLELRRLEMAMENLFGRGRYGDGDDAIAGSNPRDLRE